MNDIAAIKSRWTISVVWRRLCLPGEPRHGLNLSPFREERSPSFSIYRDDMRWKDFGTGDGGDVIDFVQQALGCDKATAVRWFGEGAAPPPRPIQKRDAPLVEIDYSIMHRWRNAPTDMSVIGRFARHKGVEMLPYVGEGSLTAIDGTIGFLFERGVKIRREIATSRSCRWLTGKGRECLWRSDKLDREKHGLIVLTEGETDCMALQTYVPPHVHVMGVPGAGWRPQYFLPRFKAWDLPVHLVMDGDAAGASGESGISQMLEDAGVEVKAHRCPTSLDVCSLDAEQMGQIVSSLTR